MWYTTADSMQHLTESSTYTINLTNTEMLGSVYDSKEQET